VRSLARSAHGQHDASRMPRSCTSVYHEMRPPRIIIRAYVRTARRWKIFTRSAARGQQGRKTKRDL